MIYFDFGGSNRAEAATNLAMILFTIALMVGSSMIMSNSVSKIALSPLEQVLSKVRSISRTIYRNVVDIHRHHAAENGTATQGGTATRDFEAGAVFDESELLELVVGKIAAL